MTGFLCVIAIDLFILGVFAGELNKRESHLRREVQMIKASNKLSSMAQSLLRHRRFIDESKFEPAKHASEQPLHVRRLNKQLASLRREWHIAGLPTGDLEALTIDITRMIAFSNDMFNGQMPDANGGAAYSGYIESSKLLYEDALARLKNIHALIDEETSSGDRIDAVTLGLASFYTTAFTWFVAAFLVYSSVTKPITRLANTCRNLMMGEVIPPPSSVSTEIGRLEATFYEMSRIVADTERSRIEFLRQMQTAQEVTLGKVSKKIEFLSSTIGTRTKQSADAFALMRSNLQGMRFLLSSMTYSLNFSDNEKLQLNLQKTSTTELLNDTANTVTWLMKRKKIELILTDAEEELECDLHLTERVIINLLSNASKFSMNGSKIHLSTSVVETSGNRQIRFDIKDFGCGISKYNQEKLFKKFSMVDSVDGVKRKGSGLGLMICKSIVEAHGGTIGCDSVENEGSTFWFTLPSKPEPQPNGQSIVAPSELKQRRGKISRTLVSLLSIYVIVQTGLLINLFSRYNYLDKAASEYARQREVLLSSQELLTQFLTWRQKTVDALLSSDIQSFLDVQPLLASQIKKTDYLLELTRGRPAIKKQLQTTKAELQIISGIADGAFDKLGSVARLEDSQEFKTADARTMLVEKSLFNILAFEKNAFDSSVLDDAASLQPVLITSVIAVSVSLLALVGLSLISWHYLRAVHELNGKAIQFAGSGVLKQTIFGADELAFLDAQLCDVAQRLRAAQGQRQDLIAIINHDLRTPLGAFLNGLEMVSAGMFGDLTDDEERLAEEATKDVESVLGVIDDFLNAEKAEFQNRSAT